MFGRKTDEEGRNFFFFSNLPSLRSHCGKGNKLQSENEIVEG